jgi:hypothetical protein
MIRRAINFVAQALGYLLIWPLLEIYRWIFKTFFRERFEQRLAAGDAAGRALLLAVERDDPELFERATGAKARPPSELPPRRE